MAYTEQILYQLQLPQFLNKFKEACLGQLLPPIEFAIDFLKTTSNPLLMVLLAILFVELVRLAILQVGSNKAESVPQTGDSRATAREVKDLKRELKGMQKTVQELKELGVSTSAVAGRASAGSSIEAKSVIDSCKDSWVKREEIALHIVQYQTLLMNEVRQLKRGGSRINSTSKIFNSSLKEPYANVQGSGPAVNGAKAGTKAPVMAKKAEVPVMFEQNPPIARSNKVQTQPPVMKNRQQARREEVKPQITKVKQQKIKQLPKQPEMQLKNEEIRLTTIEKSSSQLKQTSPQQNTFKNQEYTFENKLNPKSQVQTIQQIKIEQTANLQETTEEKQVTIDQPPKVMPPLPRQPPSAVRRAPVPPSKGQKRNPPPPPMRKT